MVKEGLLKEMTFVLGPAKGRPGREALQAEGRAGRGPGAGMCLVCLRNGGQRAGEWSGVRPEGSEGPRRLRGGGWISSESPGKPLQGLARTMCPVEQLLFLLFPPREGVGGLRLARCRVHQGCRLASFESDLFPSCCISQLFSLTVALGRAGFARLQLPTP